MRSAITVYVGHWIAGPLYRLLGIRRPGDGYRAMQYQDLQSHR
ncbi:hypothetical protein [Streptomyces anatolicus]|nr:hypothetical protein [Streptomyces anatolicus]